MAFGSNRKGSGKPHRYGVTLEEESMKATKEELVMKPNSGKGGNTGLYKVEEGTKR